MYIIYTCIYIYIYIYICLLLYTKSCVLVAVHQAVQRRAVRERDQAGKLSQAVRSVYTDHMTHDALSTFNTMTHAHTHTCMHTRTHTRMHTHTCACTHWNNPNPSLIISCATPDLSESERMCHLRTTMEISACTFCVIRIFKCTLYLYNAYVYNVLHFILNKSKIKVTSKYDHASVSQWDCDKDSSRKCLLLQSHWVDQQLCCSADNF